MADLSHGWGIAVGEDRLLDDIQDQLLAGGEAIVIGRAIGVWGIFYGFSLDVSSMLYFRVR